MGHDLAGIARQSDLAETVIPVAPERAAAALREVGAIARTALRAVRTVVSADHAPTVAQESRCAQEVLAAAGIAYSQDGARVPVPPHRAAVLAGAVRDGVANVITHSRAVLYGARDTG